MSGKTYIGNQEYRLPAQKVSGKLVIVDGLEYYVIENYHLMDPFLMSIVSNSDHWMYISSTGGLTAGRRNPDNSIFPYYTDDKIHESYLTTGSHTLIIALLNDKKYLWEPFTDTYRGIYSIRRNLYKSIAGNRVIFEEINDDLELIYRYSWMNSEKYGWIRKSSLINNSGKHKSVTVLDGLRNILPYGVSQMMQNDMSTLIDAYKKNELDIATGLAIFRLASIPVDRAIPSEALKCTTVWSTGNVPEAVLLDDTQVVTFEQGGSIKNAAESKGVRGCYYTLSDTNLEPLEETNYYYVVEMEQDSSDVEDLIYMIERRKDLPSLLEKDVALGTDRLYELVYMADGIQMSADRMSTIRHFSNVMFNSMRGGLFEKSYEISREYFEKHLHRYNKKLYPVYKKWLDGLPETLTLDNLLEKVKKNGDADLLRLSYEYLPLSFSRRHGDPSRPWNRFDIRLKEEDGTSSFSYQGNWRDIFQNWEALAFSYPSFLPSMISRFLNSSTADGYNPYRISSGGIDWEVPDPDDPWAHIGYWGDHQIIYLLRLLELVYKFNPGQLYEWHNLKIFSYANVPYRIKEYNKILKDPYETIDFDSEKNDEIEKLSSEIGADGKMILDKEGKVEKASFTEKLLVSLLAKTINFIPGAGIWMNTQRPEWNDANNALVGNGASMVTLYYMRRMIYFLRQLYDRKGHEKYIIREEIAELFTKTFNIFLESKSDVAARLDSSLRKKIMDNLGLTGSEYRRNVYEGFSGRFSSVAGNNLVEFIDLLSYYIDLSISANKRQDGLYNGYNLVNITGSAVEVMPLQEMLEGQVAVMGSGILKPVDTVELIEKMYASKLYRADQDSFMLYPDKRLKSFRENNIVSSADVYKSRLLKQMLEDGDNSIIQKDVRGKYHFNSKFRSAENLNLALDSSDQKYGPLVEEDRNLINGIYESVFQHKKFTGRSGSFYKYEGLGSIYWHMVSKMLLATAENVIKSYDENCDDDVKTNLISCYYRIRSGIGMDKSPSDYGAFPGDPYSHTPSMKGVQQPGMTGQVKEDIISRYIELGIMIENGRLHFKPVLLRKKEFIIDEKGFRSLGFTICGTPVSYIIGEKLSLKLFYKSGDVASCVDAELNRAQSLEVFSRSGLIKYIEVIVSNDQLLEI